MTIAFSRLGPGDTLWRMPAAAVTVAAVANTLVKLGIALATGSPRFKRYVGVSLGATAVVGTVAGLLVYLWF